METLDTYETPNVVIRMLCEGSDMHERPPTTYRVYVGKAVPLAGVWAWETVCESPVYGVARTSFLSEVRRAYKAGEVDYDWINDEEDFGDFEAWLETDEEEDEE